MTEKTKIKIGIYALAILMMGVIGVSGALTVIAEQFPGASQSQVQSIISFPCIAIIPATLITGKLMDIFPKKTIGITGAFIFLIGGVVPGYCTSLTVILGFRILFGVGVGIVQSVTSALVAENFTGAERESVQGHMTAAQMIGCAVMVLTGGWLGDISWNISFSVHWIAVITIVLAFLCIPLVKQQDNGDGDGGKRRTWKLTRGSWRWAFAIFALFIGVQIYAVFISYLLSEKAIGTAAQSGLTLAIADVGGFLMGIAYGRFAGFAKRMTFAAGLLIMAVSYVRVAFAESLGVMCLGGFVYGLALSICTPVVFVGTANSVDAGSSAMALSIAMCAQNLSQFLCPYIFNGVTDFFEIESPSRFVFLIGAAYLCIMGVIAAGWGTGRVVRVWRFPLHARRNN